MARKEFPERAGRTPLEINAEFVPVRALGQIAYVVLDWRASRPSA
jgi:hypothetical protein